MPLPVEKQVVIIYAGTKGYLDEHPGRASSREYEKELYAFIEAKHPAIFETIRTKKALDKDTEETLKKALKDFGTAFGKSGTEARRRRRRTDGGGAMAISQGDSQADHERQGDAEDHARDEDGRGCAPQPRAAAHHRAAPLRVKTQRGPRRASPRR